MKTPQRNKPQQTNILNAIRKIHKTIDDFHLDPNKNPTNLSGGFGLQVAIKRRKIGCNQPFDKLWQPVVDGEITLKEFEKKLSLERRLRNHRYLKENERLDDIDISPLAPPGSLGSLIYHDTNFLTNFDAQTSSGGSGSSGGDSSSSGGGDCGSFD